MSQELIEIEAGLGGLAFRLRINEAHQTLSTNHYGPTNPHDLGIVVGDGFTWHDTGTSPHKIKVYISTSPEPPSEDGWITMLLVNPTTGVVTAGPGLQAQFDLHLLKDGSRKADSLEMEASYTISLAKHVATKDYVDAKSRPPDVRWAVFGTATVQNGVGYVLIARSAKFSTIHVYSGDKPTGADLTVDVVRLRGDPPVATARSAVLADGVLYAETAVTELSLIAGDVLRLDVTGIGSTTPGGNQLMVTVPLDPV